MTERLTLEKLVEYVNTLTKKDISSQLSVTKRNCMKFVFPLDVNSRDGILQYPKTITNIFDPFVKNIIRYGVSIDEDFENLTLYRSILFLLVSEFSKKDDETQDKYISKLRNNLTYYVSNLSTLSYTDFGWSKKDIVNSIIQYKANKIILKILADYFNVNIMIINIVDEKIYIISENSIYDIFRPTVFLSYYNNIFEPLSYNNELVLNNDHELLKKLINVNRHLLILMDINAKTNNFYKVDIQLKNLEDQNFPTNITEKENKKQQMINEMEKYIYKKQWNKLTPFHKIVKVKEYIEEHYSEHSLKKSIIGNLVDFIEAGKLNTKKFVIYNPNEEKILKLPCLTINDSKNTYQIKIA